MENIEQPNEQLNGAQFNDSEGSIFGKFKDAKTLLESYNNLQAEFTRKSQKLKELEKLHKTDELSTKESASPEQTGAEVASENNHSFNVDQADISQRILQFAKQEADALDHIEKIEEQLKAQKGLLGLPNAVEIAYKLVKEQLKSEPATLAKDPEFINKYILTDSNITAAIIDQYIKSLASKQTPPKLISGESKSVVFSPNENTPKTLADANKIFTKMLEK